MRRRPAFRRYLWVGVSRGDDRVDVCVDAPALDHFDLVGVVNALDRIGEDALLGKPAHFDRVRPSAARTTSGLSGIAGIEEIFTPDVDVKLEAVAIGRPIENEREYQMAGRRWAAGWRRRGH
jgi:hypothetical protein